jgi:hypothetical protein
MVVHRSAHSAPVVPVLVYADVERQLNETARRLSLSEEVCERIVVEQVFRPDGFSLRRLPIVSTRAGARVHRTVAIGTRLDAARRPLEPPSAESVPLNVPFDPQFVHDLAETFDAGIRQPCLDLAWLVGPAGFHPAEDEHCFFAQ